MNTKSAKSSNESENNTSKEFEARNFLDRRKIKDVTLNPGTRNKIKELFHLYSSPGEEDSKKSRKFVQFTPYDTNNRVLDFLDQFEVLGVSYGQDGRGEGTRPVGVSSFQALEQRWSYIYIYIYI